MRKYQTNSRSQRGRVIPKQGRVISISFKNQTKHQKNLGNQMVASFTEDTY
jgi:hypothetical protein